MALPQGQPPARYSKQRAPRHAEENQNAKKTEKETEQELPVAHPMTPMVLHKVQVKPVHEDVIDLIPMITHYELQWKNVGKSYMVPIEKITQKSASTSPSMNAKRCVLHAIKM